MNAKLEKTKKDRILKNTFFAFIASAVYPTLMMVVNKEISVFIPQLYISIPLVLYVLAWLGYFIFHLRKKRNALILVAIVLLCFAGLQTMFGYLSIRETISFIAAKNSTQNNLEGKNASLKIIKFKRDKNKHKIVLEYQGNQTETYILFKEYSKLSKTNCQAIEMKVYKGNLGLYYIVDSDEESKICNQ